MRTLFAGGLSVCLITCGPSRDAEPARRSPAAYLEVLATTDFPLSEPRGRELSGIAWDDRAGAFWAVSDGLPKLVAVRPSADLRAWSLAEEKPVTGIEPWDGEGIAIARGRVFVANERPPRVVELDASGGVIAEMALPEQLRACRTNRCLESLSATPDGRFLFTANESTLLSDGAEGTVTEGAKIHIIRIDLATGARRDWPYVTDPVCAEGPRGEIGVSDVAALSEDELLVLERSYVPEVKNRIRIYRTRLGEDGAAPSRRDLFLDIADVDRSKPFVPNYEGIALGPRLPDGRRVLVLVSDDNARASQRSTLLVLAARLGP